MQGFFSKKETESISATGGKIHSCISCGLYKNCQNPKMKPYGGFKKRILCIGEAPGLEDDAEGKPFSGEAGDLLRQSLSRYGIDLDEDCASLNAVNCRPPKSRTPTTQEVNHCRSVLVWKALKSFQPDLILIFGDRALESVVGHRFNDSLNIHKFRGYQIPDQDLNCWICPTYDLNHLISLKQNRDYLQILRSDIKKAVDHLKKPFLKYREPEIEIVKDLRFLGKVPKHISAFDFETTGLKPQKKGHRIVSCAIASSSDHAWSFLMPKTKSGRLPLRKWLNDPRILKIAQNLKFEDTWTKVILKTNVRKWEWDTMLASHVLNNQPGTTGLKFQTYINFGVVDYASQVNDYLKSSGGNDSGNDFNRILELLKTERGVDDLLKYNALDAVYEYRLAMKQMDELCWDCLPF